MSGLRWPAALAIAAAGMAAQWALQQPLARANEVRGARRLHAAPASLAFRLSTGGVEEAASDALWLTILPKLGKPWAEPSRKAAWIESFAGVLADANPRAHYPIAYAAWFIEFIERRHPAIERVLVHAMEVERRTAFGRVVRPNADDWELPSALGMNIVLYGSAAERERGLQWLRVAASKPSCPTLILDYVAALRAKEGDPLEAWRIWGVRSGLREGREWQEICLREADAARLDVLRKWAIASGRRHRDWPTDIDQVLAEAPAPTRDALAANPALRAALVDGVVLHATTRDIQIPSLLARMEDLGRAEILAAARAFEAETGRRPADLRELEKHAGRGFLPPPANGTRWVLDPVTGVPKVGVDVLDPRLGQ